MKKKIIIISMISICLMISIFFLLSSISIRNYNPNVDNEKYILIDRELYELGYNVYGKMIFRNKYKALETFKKECYVGLKYMYEKGFPEFSTDKKVLSMYGIYGGQIGVDTNVQDVEVLRKQLYTISQFAYLYFNSNWTHYFPFFDTLS